jgi:hypothetical protein
MLILYGLPDVPNIPSIPDTLNFSIMRIGMVSSCHTESLPMPAQVVIIYLYDVGKTEGGCMLIMMTRMRSRMGTKPLWMIELPCNIRMTALRDRWERINSGK